LLNDYEPGCAGEDRTERELQRMAGDGLILGYTRCPKNGLLDAKGVDFEIHLKPCGILGIQVKNSAAGRKKWKQRQSHVPLIIATSRAAIRKQILGVLANKALHEIIYALFKACLAAEPQERRA
jgi:hypothetical protein